MRADYIWLDGEMVPWDEAQIHVLSHGLHYGFGVFEGIRAYRQSEGGLGVVALDEHLARLAHSAELCTLQLPYTAEELKDVVFEVLRANDLQGGAYIRPIAFTGHGEMGIAASGNAVRVAVAAWEWGAYLGEAGVQEGIRCTISDVRRAPHNAALHKAKLTGQYVPSILAKRDAAQRGFDEAILLDNEGMVAEGTGENLFAVIDGALVTPPMDAAILGGLTRGIVVEIANAGGYEAREAPIRLEELQQAEEIFLTGTAAEITPVREIDGRPVGAGGVGTKTAEVQAAYASLVRGGPSRWVTPVPGLG